MASIKQIGIDFKEKLGMEYYPIGMMYADSKPEGSMGFKKKVGGCIIPLILASAKGNIVSFDADTIGWECSGFYLGYQKWIFDGIECYLSNGHIQNREPERLIKDPETARKFIESMIPENLLTKATVFKPLEKFEGDEKPLLIIFFVTADQLSGLVMLLYYNNPGQENIIEARLMSSCGSIVTWPLKRLQNNEKKAIMGIHDISARARIPKELLSITLPYDLLLEAHSVINESFLTTDKWDIIKKRKALS